MRLAWFSPIPPVPSGIAACSAELVAALGGQHHIDVYCDESPVASGPGAGSAHNFVWRHRLQPYDLTVFQVGNSSHHDYMWPYLFRYPGLTVLHDAHLHHARAAALLRTRRAADYRAEFAANHPDANADLAELAVAGFDNHLYYSWPMTRLVIQASRLTAVHTAPVARALRQELPDAAVTSLRLAHGTLLTAAQARDARERVRVTYGIPRDAIVFGVLGGLTPEKRIPQILDAIREILPYAPTAHLLLAGAPAGHYDVHADVRNRGLEAHTTITGYVESDHRLTEHMAACDVSVNLRWPTAREMSGPWLRALAAGRPTIITDLAHLVDVPSLDPRTWKIAPGSGIGGAGSASSTKPDAGSRIPHSDTDLLPGSGPGSRITDPDDVSPVCVAIDILDEDHSLRLAMRRLASDPALRASLGTAGQRYWEQQHSMPRMLEDYERILAEAAALPATQVALPAHLVTDGDRLLKGTLKDFGVNSVWE
jgi:glycosyltransferase involved in cell wall biosynthesis